MIKLYPNVAEVLARYRATRMHPRPDHFFFEVPEGKPLWVRD